MSTPAPRQIPETCLDRRVRGVNLMPGTLRDQLGDQVTLLVFLRHFGCIFCRETIADLRAASESDPGFPPVLFFYVGSPTEGKAFLRRYWPTARAVADEELHFYRAFGVEKGNLVQMFRPAVVLDARRRAQAKGHANGERVGDVFRMPGVFLARSGQVLWQHEFRHAADHPDFSRVPQLVAQARG